MHLLIALSERHIIHICDTRESLGSCRGCIFFSFFFQQFFFFFQNLSLGILLHVGSSRDKNSAQPTPTCDQSRPNAKFYGTMSTRVKNTSSVNAYAHCKLYNCKYKQIKNVIPFLLFAFFFLPSSCNHSNHISYNIQMKRNLFRNDS